MREIVIEVPDNFGKTFMPQKMNCNVKRELVRCKNCAKRGNPNECPKCVDAFFYMKDSTTDDWFCADGVKRRNKHEK